MLNINTIRAYLSLGEFAYGRDLTIDEQHDYLVRQFKLTPAEAASALAAIAAADLTAALTA